MRIFRDVEQGSLEWHQLRAGVITASDCHKLFAGKSTQTYEGYIFKKVAERLTGLIDDEPVTFAMKQGIEREPEAAEYYSIAFKEELEQVAFIKPDNIDYYGCSPDRLRNNNKGLEIKCPASMAVHAKYLTIKSQSELKKFKPEYYWQIQMCLLISGYESWDFVSYHPYFTGRERMVAIEIKPDENDQLLLIKEITAANDLIEKYINEIKL